MSEDSANNDYRYLRVIEVRGNAIVCFKALPRAANDCVMGESDTLVDELHAVVAQQEWTTLILDFEGRQFTPWAAFEVVLIRLHKMLNGNLRMCNLPRLLVEQFEANHLVDIFHIFPTREDALPLQQAPDSPSRQ